MDLEAAILQQELMASREERADLRAKVYLLEKEKASLDLHLADKVSMEQVLRSHIDHLREELTLLDKGKTYLLSEREGQLKMRVESLLDNLERINKNGEVRQKQAGDLIEDLKRANRLVNKVFVIVVFDAKYFIDSLCI